jgi:hypothetical protein
MASRWTVRQAATASAAASSGPAVPAAAMASASSAASWSAGRCTRRAGTSPGLRPGPDPDGCLVGAQHSGGGDQRADQHVHAAHRLGGAGEHGVHKPVRRPGPGRCGDDLRAPLDRDMQDGQQEPAPGLDVQPVAHRSRLAGSGRGRRGVQPPARAGDRVLLVLGDGGGDHHVVDDLVRRGSPEIGGTVVSGLWLQARCAPGAPGCFPRRPLPPSRGLRGRGGVLPGRSSAAGGIEEFAEFRDAARPGAPAGLPARRSWPQARSSEVTCRHHRGVPSRSQRGAPGGQDAFPRARSRRPVRAGSAGADRAYWHGPVSGDVCPQAGPGGCGAGDGGDAGDQERGCREGERVPARGR